MEPEHKRILKERSKELNRIPLDKIKPLLIRYKMFNKYMWEDIKHMSDVVDLLPSRGPNAFQNIIAILRTENYHEEADSLENTNSSSYFLLKKLIYKMSSDPLGYCLIINNVTFEGERLEKRLGSDVDCKSLKGFFKGIGYDVDVKRNLRKAEMYDCLEKFSKRDFKDVDSAVVIILSHGAQINNKDFIYATDGQYIFKKCIIQLFSNPNCPQLLGKPKVFFFVSCRGDNKDYGASKVFPTESADSMVCKTVPSFTDILIVHSTLPDNLSMRDHEKGTWFCQDLISVFKDNHSKYDIETMMKLVNEKLKERIALEDRVTQGAPVENRLFKSLMLCRIPGT